MISETLTDRTYRIKFENGVTLLVYGNPANPTVHLAAAMHAGQYLDPPSQPGLAQVVSLMLMRGTRLRSKLEIAQVLEDVGADLDISANRFLVRADGQALSKDFDTLLKIFSEVMSGPVFPEDELEKLKQQLIGKLRRQQENTSVRAYERFVQLVFPPGNPFYKPSIEERIASIESMTGDDLKRFYLDVYGAETLTIVLVGDIETESVVRQAEESFGPLTRGIARPIEVIRVEPAGQTYFEIVPMKDKANTDIFLGHAGQLRRTDPDYYAAYLANSALGQSSLSSRLGLRVRDQEGLTYGIVSRFFEPGFADGPWAVNLTVNPENVRKAIDSTLDVLNSYVASGVTEQELKDEKSSFIGGFIVGLGSNGALASNLLSMEIYGLGVEHLDALPKLVRGITRDEVNEAVRRYIRPDRLITVIAGDYQPA